MEYDVAIIGSGAGGGAAALSLSRAGLNVVVLEKGPDYDREDYPNDEVSSLWRDLFVPPVHEQPHVVAHSSLAEPRRMPIGWTANCVGGGTVHMGAYLSRFHPDDFRMKKLHGSFEELEDWPYDYEELEFYYGRAEWEVGVSGQSGSNPFAGHRSMPYPLPPLDTHPLAHALDESCSRLGYQAFPSPRGINSRPYQGRPTCAYCRTCSGYGCRTGARGTAKEAFINRALETGRCELVALAMVKEVTYDAKRHRANGCIYIDHDGIEHRIRARIVCVACSAIETARLLLLSKNTSFPDGLANSSGKIGKYLQFHSTSAGRGVFDPEAFPKSVFDDLNPFIGRSVMDFYFLPKGVSEIPKGGLIVFHYGGSSPIMGAKLASQSREGFRLWGMDLKKKLGKQYRQESRKISFEVHHDFLPNERTYTGLDPEVTDKWGLPVARIHLDPCEHHKKAGRFVVDRGLDILREMGADTADGFIVGETAFFLIEGTCRAGDDPKSSVVNRYCQTHDIENLFIVDGSFMPTSGGAPPTLTIIANSLRTADHIVERARQGDFH